MFHFNPPPSLCAGEHAVFGGKRAEVGADLAQLAAPPAPSSRVVSWRLADAATVWLFCSSVQGQVDGDPSSLGLAQTLGGS